MNEIIIPSTDAEKKKIVKFMQSKLDSFYGEGMLPDTANYERVRLMNNRELEEEFKKVFKQNHNKFYFLK